MNRFVLSDPASFGRIDRPTAHRQVHLSELKGMFADEESWQRLIDRDDPVVYEVFMVEPESPVGWDMSYGTTVMHPGQVGGEYFFSKGHRHMPADRPELYYVLGGAGVLLLAELSADGRVETTEKVDLTPGLVAYVEARYAHRVVNTGAVDLVFFSAWPSDTGHDYETVSRSGFGLRLRG
jgi:glucose-6-phosphate isomerase